MEIFDKNTRGNAVTTADFSILFEKSQVAIFFRGILQLFQRKSPFGQLKIFLCCIKRQKQRYFRSLAKRKAFLTNLQPFELGRIFRISETRSRKRSGFLPASR